MLVCLQHFGFDLKQSKWWCRKLDLGKLTPKICSLQNTVNPYPNFMISWKSIHRSYTKRHTKKFNASHKDHASYSLPSHLHHIDDTAVFKCKLKDELFRQAYDNQQLALSGRS